MNHSIIHSHESSRASRTFIVRVRSNVPTIIHGFHEMKWMKSLSLIKPVCGGFYLAATLPHVFFPSVAAVEKTGGKYVAFGSQALRPDVRLNSALTYPIRPSNKISKVCSHSPNTGGSQLVLGRQLSFLPHSASRASACNATLEWSKKSLLLARECMQPWTCE